MTKTAEQKPTLYGSIFEDDGGMISNDLRK